MAAQKWVYDFVEGSREMRDLLGGKGANVVEMTRVLGAEVVPAGFTITTEACAEYMRLGREPDGLQQQVAEALGRLEDRAAKRFGDDRDPLLVSVRSGARESMPGMLDTILNLGLNDQAVVGLAQSTDNEPFAWDAYRRLVQMFGNVVHGIRGEEFERAIEELRREHDAATDAELPVRALEQLVERFQGLYEFPRDSQTQLRQAVRAVFDSWRGERAVQYRRINRIPDDWGTAVNVQEMVFGNKGETSATGVAFSRDEVTGAPEPSGDFLINARGEDEVSGVRTPRDLRELKDVMPEVGERLMEVLRTLEAHYKDMQGTEFTVEEGQLYMLQTRNAKRPAQAAVRFAVDAVEEGLLTRKEALSTIDSGSLDALLHPTFDRGEGYRVLARGVAASPGAAEGAIVFSAREAVTAAAGHRRDPRPSVHRGRRCGGIPRRQGDPDLRRRQGLARRAGGPGDGRPGGDACEFGAEGIGLCRTEHMFMAEDRQPKMRAMIMARDGDGRRRALRELLPLQQQQDFKGIFEATRGLPVTIRLLDPPLHEFLPNQPELRAHVERARLEHHDDLEELEALLTRVEFDKAGLDYVSCSPPRVPIARVAAARAVLGKPS